MYGVGMINPLFCWSRRYAYLAWNGNLVISRPSNAYPLECKTPRWFHRSSPTSLCSNKPCFCFMCSACILMLVAFVESNRGRLDSRLSIFPACPHDYHRVADSLRDAIKYLVCMAANASCTSRTPPFFVFCDAGTNLIRYAPDIRHHWHSSAAGAIKKASLFSTGWSVLPGVATQGLRLPTRGRKQDGPGYSTVTSARKRSCRCLQSQDWVRSR